MPKSLWSTLQLAEFLAVLSDCETEASAALAAVERAAEALEAEVAAIVCGSKVVAAVGYPEGAVPAAELSSVSEGRGELAVPGIGACPATAVAVGEEVARLLQADLGGVTRYEPDQPLTLVAAWGEGRKLVPVGTRVALEGESAATTMLQSGLPVRIASYEGLSGPAAALMREL